MTPLTPDLVLWGQEVQASCMVEVGSQQTPLISVEEYLFGWCYGEYHQATVRRSMSPAGWRGA